jgi:cytochrome c-type biogenesis protein CcmH/NrfG
MGSKRQMALRCAAVLVLAGVLAGCRGGDQAASDGAGGSEQQLAPNYAGIIEEYRSVLTKDPHNLAAIIGLGNALFEEARWREAVLAYEQALQLDPHNAQILTDMGICYRNLGMYQEAINSLTRALNVEPVHQEALFNLGAVFAYDRPDRGRAIEIWNRLLHVAPKHPRAEEVQTALRKLRAAGGEGPR